MSNIFKHNLNNLVTLLLRMAAILYLFVVVYPYIVEPGFENTFGIWAVRWILIILLAAATLILFMLRRAEFLLYGFFLVFIAAFYQLFVTLISNDPLPGIFVHVYVSITAIYFITKDLRSSHTHHRQQRGSKESKSS